MAVVHAALDAGVTLLDTADAYCLDDTETGHNERLLRARSVELDGRPLARSGRHQGRPHSPRRPMGARRPRHATWPQPARRAARALGVERIALYQLHAPDPAHAARHQRARPGRAQARRPRRAASASATSRLGSSRRRGGIADIAAVQVELSPLARRQASANGVAECCVGRTASACSPTGRSAERRSARSLERDPVLRELAERHGATPAEVALAWLCRTSRPLIVPLPGPTRPETPRSLGARRRASALTDDDRARARRAASPRAACCGCPSGAAPAAAPRPGRRRARHGLAGGGQDHARPRARGAGLPAAEPRRGGRPPRGSAARRSTACSRRGSGASCSTTPTPRAIPATR